MNGSTPAPVLHRRLRALGTALHNAERLGAKTDKPEGVRYIQMSDTAARTFAALCHEAAAALRASGRRE